MELKIAKNKISENIDVFLTRTLGYFKMPNTNPTKEQNFVKPLSKAGYPRFHIYISERKTEYAFNLHLDQKRAVYKGATAHSGEYEESEVLKKEFERIRSKFFV